MTEKGKNINKCVQLNLHIKRHSNYDIVSSTCNESHFWTAINMIHVPELNRRTSHVPNDWLWSTDFYCNKLDWEGGHL